MRIRWKLGTGFGLVIGLAGALGAVAVWQLGTIDDHATELREEVLPELLAARQIEAYVQQSAERWQEYGLTHQPEAAERAAEAHDAAVAQIEQVRAGSHGRMAEFAERAEAAMGAYRDATDATEDAVGRLREERDGLMRSATIALEETQYLLDEQRERVEDAQAADFRAPAGQSAADVRTRRLQDLSRLNEIRVVTGDIHRAALQSLETRDPIRLQGALPGFGQVQVHFSILRANAADEQEQQILEEINDAIIEYQDYATGLAEAQEALAELRHVRAETSEQALGAVVDLANHTAENGERASEGVVGVVREAGATLGIGLFLVGLLAFGIAAWTTRSLTQPLGQLVHGLRDIAEGEGDLTRRVDERRADELGDVGYWFNRLMDRIHGMIVQLSGASRDVTDGVARIAASNAQIESGMTEQSDQTQQVSSAIEEMSSSIHDVSRQTSEAASAAVQAGETAADGRETVQGLVTRMQEVAASVERAGEAVTALGHSGEQIGEIISMIDGIAEQTNLLALNAAIEAARAGEQGRGFAVVADEVRSLSQRTVDATQQVSEALQQIQERTDTAVQGMQQSSGQVNDGLGQAEAAGAALQRIVEKAQSVAENVQSIATAAEQQSNVAAEIAQNVDAVNQVTQQTSGGVNQAAQTAQQLRREAEALQELVQQFKVTEGGPSS
ncbi:methyl-accepting chemotaxis protein [Halorhodospira halophila]|uniref:Methyl-accepting chemotaxis sensory transducer n=1 Tax=Halorhodospira halophila (strain DSM 244 / SL1) TaxID=349124 RepID=A1WXR6_HALHL|nr:methyl-accepting chemotaxis protein [Halorhodospira halophila]ABM62478.1 methyl-accepting chemotaxis sensory transducer [Halorhodospira halophila SL1]